MRSSSLFVLVALSVLGAACTGSGAGAETARMTRVPTETGLGGLWMASPAKPEGNLEVASWNDQGTSDLWMKRGSDSSVELPEKQTPRLDTFLSRVTPRDVPTFVQVTNPARTRQ